MTAKVSQITEGLPQLQQRQLTATFFVMTVVLGKPGWMSPRDLRRLRDAGMTVAAHTWDHHRVDRYTGADWSVQLDQPRELLERLLRTPVEHFAYPYGAWSTADFPHLRNAGYSTAFQLSDRGVDRAEPLLTLRRLLVSSWTGPQLLAAVAAARRPPPPGRVAVSGVSSGPPNLAPGVCLVGWSGRRSPRCGRWSRRVQEAEYVAPPRAHGGGHAGGLGYVGAEAGVEADHGGSEAVVVPLGDVADDDVLRHRRRSEACAALLGRPWVVCAAHRRSTRPFASNGTRVSLVRRP